MNTARLTTPPKQGVVQRKAVTPPKNSAELRGFLLQQMCLVADGTQDSADAKAICNYAQQIYNTLNMEIRHAASIKNLGDQPIKPVSFEGAG